MTITKNIRLVLLFGVYIGLLALFSIWLNVLPILIISTVVGVVFAGSIYQSPSTAVSLLVLFRIYKKGGIQYVTEDYFSPNSKSHSLKVTYYRDNEQGGVFFELVVIGILVAGLPVSLILHYLQ